MSTISPSPGLRVAGTQTGDTAHLVLEGELDPATVGELRRIGFAYVAHGARHVIVDGADLTFLDSSGLGCLLELHGAVAPKGGSVKVANPRPLVRRVLAVTGFDQVIDVAP